MHAAPPVRITLAHEPAWSSFVIGCAAAAAANLGAWGALHVQAPMAIAGVLALLAASMAGWLAWRLLRRRPAERGVLVWDGAVWLWVRDPKGSAAGDVRVMIDLGAWVLLRFMPETAAPAATWLFVSRQQGGALWPQWRAALFSRRHGPAPNTAAERS